MQGFYNTIPLAPPGPTHSMSLFDLVRTQDARSIYRWDDFLPETRIQKTSIDFPLQKAHRHRYSSIISNVKKTKLYHQYAIWNCK